MSKVKTLNIGRRFGDDRARKEYFTFSGINKNGKHYEYLMTSKQMKVWEESVIKRVVNQVKKAMNFASNHKPKRK